MTYALVLLAIVVGSGWLEIAFRTRVLRRRRRWLATVLPVAAGFLVWDAYAVSQGHWGFDPSRILGVTLPGGVPLEEALFFLVVPTAAILTLEAVRVARGWRVGDEADPDGPAAGS